MKEIIIECQGITPMFMGGANGNENILRPPSLKGVLRFWWRAMNGHMSLTELKKKESEYFGGTEPATRSKIIIHPFDELKRKEEKISKTPHRENPYEQAAVIVRFSIKISYHESIDLDVKNLIKVAFVLGGVGNRSRRGFGSFKIISINGDEPFSTIESYQNFIQNITTLESSTMADYPYIKKVQIGKEYDDYQSLLVQIGQSSHENDFDTLGFAKRKLKFASPIYVSAIQVGKKLHPIITTLNTPKIIEGKIEKQEAFKKAIL